MTRCRVGAAATGVQGGADRQPGDQVGGSEARLAPWCGLALACMLLCAVLPACPWRALHSAPGLLKFLQGRQSCLLTLLLIPHRRHKWCAT